MLGYRCYFLGKESQILAREDFYADTETEALAIARSFALEKKPDGCFELWEGTRYLHSEDCRGSVQPLGVAA